MRFAGYFSAYTKKYLLEFRQAETPGAGIVATTAVGSYPALSPLPHPALSAGQAVYFLLRSLSKSQAPE